MRGASIKPIGYDPENPGPQPPWFAPLMPAGHAVLAGEIVRQADPARGCPPERLRGLCEAYAAVAELPAEVEDEYGVAEVVERATADYRDWEAARAQIGAPELTYYLRLTQQQAEASDRMEELTRLRGAALAEYQRQTGASLRAVVAELRASGYAVTPAGIKWLTDHARPAPAGG